MLAISPDPVPYAEFILRYLMQRVTPDGDTWAVAETEHAVDGDRWFWADDNAKVLEFLALPELWRKWPDRCREVLEFVESYCDGPFILRRTGHARLEQSSFANGIGRWVHTFMHLSCDLPKGVVNVGMRFHDSRTARNLILTNNFVHFTFQGATYRLAVEPGIVAHEARFEDGRLALSHSSELHFDHQGRSVRLGRITYGYRFDSRSMFLDAEAVLELDREVRVENVVVTIAQNDLSHQENGVHYSAIGIRMPGQEPIRFHGKPGHSSLPCKGADYWSIGQFAEMRGFALAIHTLPQTPATLMAVDAVVHGNGQLDWVFAQHAFYGPQQPGATLRAAERKIITAGGFYDRVEDCAGLVQRQAALPPHHPLDLSISYDYGAEINAFARCYRTLASMGDAPEVVALRERARALFDRFWQVYDEIYLSRHFSDPAAIFSRPLAFVIYGLIDMAVATGEEKYKDGIRDAVRVLLDFERNFAGPDGKTESAFLMGQVTCVAPFVDCHSAAILALLRALPVIEDPIIITSIDRALDAFRCETIAIELGDMRKQDLITAHWTNEQGQRLNPHAFWNFCAGLTLRVFKLLRQSKHQATREILERHLPNIEIYEALLQLQVRRSLRAREGGALEVLTSRLAGEGNSETQPWVALGVVADSGDL
jgi:hypothetical protein